MGFPSVTWLANEPQELGVADASSVAVKYVGLPRGYQGGDVLPEAREQPLPEVEVTTPPLHVQGPTSPWWPGNEDLSQLEAGVQDPPKTILVSSMIRPFTNSDEKLGGVGVAGRSLVHLKTSRRSDAL